MPAPLQCPLRPRDRVRLEGLLRKGVQQVRVVVRALALLQLDRGGGASAAARAVGLTPQAVRLIAQRYQRGGVDAAIYEGPRPGAAEVLTSSEKQRIIAMVCSAPPVGAARWTVRLIAEEAIKRRVVPRVGRETVRVLLQSHDLKPWREKNVVRG
jgi:putative transposase